VPAQAGIQFLRNAWIPACAGMSGMGTKPEPHH
jgi:hypothetical protein